MPVAMCVCALCWYRRTRRRREEGQRHYRAIVSDKAVGLDALPHEYRQSLPHMWYFLKSPICSGFQQRTLGSLDGLACGRIAMSVMITSDGTGLIVSKCHHNGGYIGFIWRTAGLTWQARDQGQ